MYSSLKTFTQARKIHSHILTRFQFIGSSFYITRYTQYMETSAAIILRHKYINDRQQKTTAQNTKRLYIYWIYVCMRKRGAKYFCCCYRCPYIQLHTTNRTLYCENCEAWNWYCTHLITVFGEPFHSVCSWLSKGKHILVGTKSLIKFIRYSWFCSRFVQKILLRENLNQQSCAVVVMKNFRTFWSIKERKAEGHSSIENKANK